MCGIFALLNNSNVPDDFVINQIKKGENRGPDNSQTLKILDNFTLGFHRLAINGLNQESNQPFDIDNVILICNGEIYNYKELYKFMNIKPKTDSDCEVIIYLYRKYGIEQTLKMLDGVFAFILYDSIENKIFIIKIHFIIVLKNLNQELILFFNIMNLDGNQQLIINHIIFIHFHLRYIQKTFRNL
jgi:asparagine synthase (glutamine-hydrolysing)